MTDIPVYIECKIAGLLLINCSNFKWKPNSPASCSGLFLPVYRTSRGFLPKTWRHWSWSQWHDTETAPWGARLQLKEVMTQSRWHGCSRILPPSILCVGEWGSGCLTAGESKAPDLLLKPGYGGSGLSDAERDFVVYSLYLYIYL